LKKTNSTTTTNTPTTVENVNQNTNNDKIPNDEKYTIRKYNIEEITEALNKKDEEYKYNIYATKKYLLYRLIQLSTEKDNEIKKYQVEIETEDTDKYTLNDYKSVILYIENKSSIKPAFVLKDERNCFTVTFTSKKDKEEFIKNPSPFIKITETYN